MEEDASIDPATSRVLSHTGPTSDRSEESICSSTLLQDSRYPAYRESEASSSTGLVVGPRLPSSSKIRATWPFRVLGSPAAIALVAGRPARPEICFLVRAPALFMPADRPLLGLAPPVDRLTTLTETAAGAFSSSSASCCKKWCGAVLLMMRCDDRRGRPWLTLWSGPRPSRFPSEKARENFGGTFGETLRILGKRENGETKECLKN
mmetsp:Transcript_9591/g.34239  ORF Transcript_9591/g.34239 Transcript_9591/m.34239 type:complete len:207 (-) Transcript_9591:1861-2481(-)